MPTPLLSVGYVQTMVQNTVYALPARACHMFFQGAGASVEFSNDGTNWTVGAASPQSLTVGAGFARSTGADALVTLKPLG